MDIHLLPFTVTVWLALPICIGVFILCLVTVTREQASPRKPDKPV